MHFRHRILHFIQALPSAILWLGIILGMSSAQIVCAQTIPEAENKLAQHAPPPYQLGELVNDQGVWTLVNLDGAEAGYIFESEPLAPIPGFSGRPINMVVSMSKQGKLLEVKLLSQGEPVFVSGLGEAPLHQFLDQYGGLSIFDPIAVSVPYGRVEGASTQIYLDGVTKATASVRIAHESILAAAYAVAKINLPGIQASTKPLVPDLYNSEQLTFDDLVEQGIAKHHVVTNKEIQERFLGTQWELDDDIALESPEAPYLDLWIIDITPPAVARAVLDEEGMRKLSNFLAISPDDEPILLIEQGRHGLVSEDFIRNTEPDLLSARQNGLPVALRDADLELSLLPEMPSGNQIVVRSDRRLGLDPTQPWELTFKAIRTHGSFMPTVGSQDITISHQSPKRFYISPESPRTLSAFENALRARLLDNIGVVVLLLVLMSVMLFKLHPLANARHFTHMRLIYLVLLIGFVGWWGQGQLSIVTVLGVIQALFSGQSLSFLLYDPFSLAIWLAVIVSFFVWGRGLFCGWLCPYGAMQEIVAYLSRLLGIKQIKIRDKLDKPLKKIKYGLLALLVIATLFYPALSQVLVEVEPFKTAVTTYFMREWHYVVYALLWLSISLVIFKGFCRYVCPLGAFMAMGGLLRRKNWIERRTECGTPCQLCKVRCQYNAIKKSGAISYDECFQCLDCVTIYHDVNSCAPLMLKQKGKQV